VDKRLTWGFEWCVTKVHHGFRIERDPGGRWHTYRPDGTEILTGPPLRV
jgi:hypothetical protein